MQKCTPFFGEIKILNAGDKAEVVSRVYEINENSGGNGAFMNSTLTSVTIYYISNRYFSASR